MYMMTYMKPYMMTSFLKILIWMTLLSLCDAEGTETSLFDVVFDDYVADIRPRRNSSHPVEVVLRLEFLQLNQIDEKSQMQSASVLLQAVWDDDYLSWLPSTFNGISEIVVKPDKIWLPDFGVKNSVGAFYQEAFFKHLRVQVDSMGRVIWKVGGQFDTSCRLDTTAYPFDRQHCSIVVENWAYSNRVVLLLNGSDHVSRSQYIENGLWELVGTSVVTKDFFFEDQPNVSYRQIKFNLHWRRKVQYYVVNIMLPVSFLLIIAMLVFWLPPDAGEKISLSVTILLAFAVMQVVISDSTPENSDSTPILTLFVSLTMGLSTLSAITTILVLYLHYKSAVKRVPKIITVVFFKFIARALCMDIHLQDHSDMAEQDRKPLIVSVNDDERISVNERSLVDDPLPAADVTDSPIGDHAHTDESPVTPQAPVDYTRDTLRALSAQLDVVTAQMNVMTSQIVDDEKDLGVILEWQAVARVIDRLLFWIVLLVLVCSLIYLGAVRVDDDDNKETS